jgi:hypothetical protein
MEHDPILVDAIQQTMTSLMKKLKVGMDDGPFGEFVVLTPAEATLAYRLITPKG